MSIVCCKEFKGWCKSFTRTETYLSVLQALFLVVLIVSLTFIILHFIACYKNKKTSKIEKIVETSSQTPNITEEENILEILTTIAPTEQPITTPTPLPKGIECTWTPSAKTTAVTHYYDTDFTSKTSVRLHTPTITIKSDNLSEIGTTELSLLETWTNKELPYVENIDAYDGKEAEELKKGFLLALVKIKPPLDITFACTLTIVAESWVLTAASCIEAIEEVDSLDSFVMMRGFGEKVYGSVHAVSDILIHPQYQGVNRTYDLAALKSEDRLVKDKSQIAVLPTMVDYLSVTIGESFSILGYGKYRNLDKDSRARSIREVSVYTLPSQQCPDLENDAWSLRHLIGGSRQLRGGCSAGPLCVGSLQNRTLPCYYCAGTPLLRRRLLLAIMSDNPHCGITCDPVLYVNLASLRDWLDSVIDSDG